MKKSASPSRDRRNLLLILLLAVLCIGAAELAACYFFEPVLYEQITAPVRRGAQAAARVCVRTASAFSQASEQVHRQISLRIAAAGEQVSTAWEQLSAPEDELSGQDSQLAGDPVLTDEPPAADPAITELNVINGQEILTGGTIPIVYFNQGSEAWAEELYGTDDIGRYGCGPTAMAMVISSMTDTDADPLRMAQWAVSRGHWAKRNGSRLSIVEDAAAEYGLIAAPLEERTPETLLNVLLSGDLLVALMSPGHFTKSGHFIVLRGVTPSGSVLVADPNSTERSLMEWEPELILEELSSSTDHGAPLWVISRKGNW